MQPRSRILGLNPSFFFVLAIIYLLLLLLIAVLYERDFYGVKRHLGEVIGNILPIGVPWFGALGAVLISLQGVFRHSEDWKRSYNYWHLARPVFGAVLSIVAYFIFVLILRAAGTPPSWIGTAEVPPVGDLVVYYVLAFLVGYREENFAELVRRATDLIFRPGGLATLPAPAVIFEREEDDDRRTVIRDLAMEAEVKEPPAQASTKVYVTNTGSAPLTAPVVVIEDVDSPQSEAFSKGEDEITGKDLPPSKSNSVEVIFTPRETRNYMGDLRVSSPSLPAPAVLPLSGRGKDPESPSAS